MAIQISHTDKIASGLLFVLTAVVFYLSRDFPTGISETSPAFYPRVIVGLISVFAFAQLVRSIRSDTGQTYELTMSKVTTVTIAAALVIGYVVTMPFLGFLIGTILFLVVSMHFSGVEKLRKSVPVATGLTLVLHYVFVAFLRVPLPDNAFVPIGRMLPSLWIFGGVIA